MAQKSFLTLNSWVWIEREREREGVRIRLLVVNPKVCTSATHNTYHEKFYRVTQYKNNFSFRRKLFVTLFLGGGEVKKLFVYWLEKWHLKIAKTLLASSSLSSLSFLCAILTMFDVECGHDDGEPFCSPIRTFEYFFIRTRHTTYAIAEVRTHKHTHTNTRRSYLFCGYYNFHNWFLTFAHKSVNTFHERSFECIFFSFSMATKIVQKS